MAPPVLVLMTRSLSLRLENAAPNLAAVTLSTNLRFEKVDSRRSRKRGKRPRVRKTEK